MTDLNDVNAPVALPAESKEPAWAIESYNLAVSDVAHRLNVSPKTIYNWVGSGVLKPIRLGPKLLRFREEDLKELITKK